MIGESDEETQDKKTERKTEKKADADKFTFLQAVVSVLFLAIGSVEEEKKTEKVKSSVHFDWLTVCCCCCCRLFVRSNGSLLSYKCFTGITSRVNESTEQYSTVDAGWQESKSAIVQ